jgi:hypothetical protein
LHRKQKKLIAAEEKQARRRALARSPEAGVQARRWPGADQKRRSVHGLTIARRP